MEAAAVAGMGAEGLLGIDVAHQGRLLEKLEAELRLLHVEVGELTSMKHGRGVFVRNGPHVMFQVKDKQKLIAQKQEELKRKQNERDEARQRLEDLQRQLREARRSPSSIIRP